MSVAWRDGVTLTFEWAMSSFLGVPGTWDAAIWDTSVWGSDVLWIDVSDYARVFSSSRSFSRGMLGWNTGSASLRLANQDRRFDPANLSSPYASAGVTGIRPWRPVRISATYAGTRYYIFTGYNTAVQETWVAGMSDTYVTLPCQDEWARLGTVDGFVQAPVGAGELSGARIHRVLNMANHTGSRNVDVGEVTMLATDLSSGAIAALNLTADSEGGAAYIDRDGAFVFEQRDALVGNTRSNIPQAVFGDGSGAELPCWDIQVSYDGDLLRNIVSYTRVGGAAQTYADSASRGMYGDHRETRTDLMCQTDAQALDLASWRVVQYSQPEFRVSQIVIKPRANPARLFPQVLGRRIRDLIQVVIRPLGGGTAITQNCFIAGISHDVTNDDWTTTFDLWSAAAYRNVGRWDTGTWDSSIWFM